MLAGKTMICHAFDQHIWMAYKDNVLVDGREWVGPNSVDVTLSDQFMWVHSLDHTEGGFADKGIIDPYRPSTMKLQTETRKELVLYPGDFVLGATREHFDISHAVARNGGRPEGSECHYFAQMYEGRSTMGRLGIGTHVTAGFGDYGFSNPFTLEIFNIGMSGVRLHAGMRIGQVYFQEVKRPAHYDGAYSRKQAGPVAPVLGKDRF